MSNKRQRRDRRVNRTREVERNREAWNAKVRANLQAARDKEIVDKAVEIGRAVRLNRDDIGEAVMRQLEWAEFKDSLQPRERLIAIKACFEELNSKGDLL